MDTAKAYWQEPKCKRCWVSARPGSLLCSRSIGKIRKPSPSRTRGIHPVGCLPRLRPRSRESCCARSRSLKTNACPSTTKEVPGIRFKKAQQAGNTLFRPFSMPDPYTSPKDVFCLRENRMVDGYRRISLFNHTIQVPNVDPYHDVEIHLVPDTVKQVMQIRIWSTDKMVHSVSLPLQEFKVHL